jgi:hypothetical protein
MFCEEGVSLGKLALSGRALSSQFCCHWDLLALFDCALSFVLYQLREDGRWLGRKRMIVNCSWPCDYRL